MESRGRKRREPGSSTVCPTCDASLRSMNRSDRARHTDNCHKLAKGNNVERSNSLFVSSSSSNKTSNKQSNNTSIKDFIKPIESSDFIQADSGLSAVADRNWAQQQVAFLHPNSAVHSQIHCEHQANSRSDKRPSKRAKTCNCLDCDIRTLRNEIHSIDTQIASLNEQRSRAWTAYQAKAKSRMLDTSSYQPYTNAAHDSGFEDFVLRTPLESLSPPVGQSPSLDHAHLASGQFWQLQASHLNVPLHDLSFLRVEPRPQPVAPTNPYLVRSTSPIVPHIVSSSAQPNVQSNIPKPITQTPNQNITVVSPAAVAEATQQPITSSKPVHEPISSPTLIPATPVVSEAMSSITEIDLVPISTTIDLIPITANIDLTQIMVPVKANVDLTSTHAPVIADIDLTTLDDTFDLPSDSEPGAYSFETHSPAAYVDDSFDMTQSNSPNSLSNEPYSPDVTYVSSRCSMPPLEPGSPVSPRPETNDCEMIDMTTNKPFDVTNRVHVVEILSSSTSVSSRAPLPLHPTTAKSSGPKATFALAKDDSVLSINQPSHVSKSSVKPSVSVHLSLSQPHVPSPRNHVTSPLASPLASPLPSPLPSPMGAPLISPRYYPIDITKPSSWVTLSFVNLVAAVGLDKFDFSKVGEPILSRWMNELGLKSKSSKQMQERLTDILETLRNTVEPPGQSPVASPVAVFPSPSQPAPAPSQSLIHNVRTFIRNHESLWLDVLLAQNIDFNCLYSCLQGAGIPVNKAELTAVLDSENIIFTQANKSKPRNRQAKAAA